MHITIIHPAIGHSKTKKYVKYWQMESLPSAAIAGLTPDDVKISFYDDRIEKINYEKCDAAVISVETYTAKRSYQIATIYREMGIPVIMGGFHTTLIPEEVSQYAEAIVIGEAEGIWHQVISDLKNNKLKKIYESKIPTSLDKIKVDRSIFKNKKYLPIGLIETGRGCPYNCNFCAIQTFFKNSYRKRNIQDVIDEINSIKNQRKFFFFVDDNFAGDIDKAKQLLKAIIPLKIRWVTQMTIDCAQDEELLSLLEQSGCEAILIGFESINENNLKQMRKTFNTKKLTYKQSLKNLEKYNIRIYATFVFGYAYDDRDAFTKTLEFALESKFFIAAFNHLLPFPGTPLYKELEQDNRLLYDKWWLDDNYKYNDLAYTPANLEPEELTKYCIKIRKDFYSFKNIFKRWLYKVNRNNSFSIKNFLPINYAHKTDIDLRNKYPLGDENFIGEITKSESQIKNNV